MTRGALERRPGTMEDRLMVTADPHVAVECRKVGKDFGAAIRRLRPDRRRSDGALGRTDLARRAQRLRQNDTDLDHRRLAVPDRGDVDVFGASQSKMPPRRLVCEFRAANVGFVFQQYNLLPASPRPRTWPCRC